MPSCIYGETFCVMYNVLVGVDQRIICESESDIVRETRVRML